MAEFTKAYKKLEVVDISKFKNDWIIIDNFPSYKINSDGIVININTNKVLKHCINNGYYDVTLTKNKRHYRIKIHRLLANAFIPKVEDKPYIDHIDGNKLNNSIDNLRWVDSYDNYHNVITEAKTKNSIIEYNKVNKSVKVKAIDKFGNVTIYDSIGDAAKAVNGDTGTISAICSNKIKYSKGYSYRPITHKGYKWRYLYG